MNKDRELNVWALKVMQDELSWRQSRPELVRRDTQGVIAFRPNDRGWLLPTGTIGATD